MSTADQRANLREVRNVEHLLDSIKCRLEERRMIFLFSRGWESTRGAPVMFTHPDRPGEVYRMEQLQQMVEREAAKMEEETKP